MAIIDEIDLEILNLLCSNSRFTWKEIGEIVHMTGQAVSWRIKRLEDLGVIEGYTTKINLSKLGKPLLAIVTVFMKTTNHQSFHNFVNGCSEIVEAFRVSGEGCYSLKIIVATHEELIDILDQILKFGNYKVNLSINKIK